MLVIEVLELLALGGHVFEILLQVGILIFDHLRVLLETLLKNLILFLKSAICFTAHAKLMVHTILYLLKLLFLSDKLSLCLLQAFFQLNRIKLLAVFKRFFVIPFNLKLLNWVLYIVSKVGC